MKLISYVHEKLNAVRKNSFYVHLQIIELWNLKVGMGLRNHLGQWFSHFCGNSPISVEVFLRFLRCTI